MEFTFTIPGVPTPMKRPRLSKSGVINPDAAKKRADKWIIAIKYRDIPNDLPVSVYIQYHMPIPRTFTKAKKEQAANNDLIHSYKPDIDNLIKHTLDVLSGIVFKDDGQVHSIVARKVYSDNPRTEIRVFFGED